MNGRHKCWRCTRDLNVAVPPKYEDVVVRCPRCHAANVLRDDVPAKPVQIIVDKPLESWLDYVETK